MIHTTWAWSLHIGVIWINTLFYIKNQMSMEFLCEIPGRTDRRRSCMTATTHRLFSASSSFMPCSRTTSSRAAVTPLTCSDPGGRISISITCSSFSCGHKRHVIQTESVKEPSPITGMWAGSTSDRWTETTVAVTPVSSPLPFSCVFCPECAWKRWPKIPGECHTEHRCKGHQSWREASEPFLKEEKFVH